METTKNQSKEALLNSFDANEDNREIEDFELSEDDQEYLDEINEDPNTKPIVNGRKGRPKGVKNRPKTLEQLSQSSYVDEDDIFIFAKSFMSSTGHSIRLLLYRNSAFLTEARLNLQSDLKDGQLASWADIQKRYGGGIYTLKIYDNNLGKFVKKQVQEIEHIQQENISQAMPLIDSIQEMDNEPQNQNQNQNQNYQQPINVNMPRQKSLLEQIKEAAPIIALLKDLFLPKTPEVNPMELERRLDEKLERERRQMKEDFQTQQRLIKEAVDEKMQYMTPPEEKSIIGEIIDVVKTTGNIIDSKAKLEMSRREEASRKQLPMPQPQQQQAPLRNVSTKKEIDNNPEKEKEALVSFVAEKLMSGTEIEAIINEINNKPKIKERFLKHDKNELVKKAKVMLQLDDSTVSNLEGWVNKLYVSIGKTTKLKSKSKQKR